MASGKVFRVLKKKYKHILFLATVKWGFIALFLCGGWLPSKAQPLPRAEYFNTPITQPPLNTEKWKSLTKDLSYEEDGAKKEDPKHRKANTRGTGEGDEDLSNTTSGRMSPFWAAVFKFLVIGLAVIVLAVVLYYILGSGSVFHPKGRKVQSVSETISIETIEANIHESDLDDHIHQAVKQQNYNMAVRLYYLAVIKELSLNKWIRWKRDKTNRDYLREMKATSLYPSYLEATRIFERVWYGNAVLQEKDFNLLRPGFIQLLNEIKKTKPTALSLSPV